MDTFEDFFVAGTDAQSRKVAELLSAAGVRVRSRVDSATQEHVVAVHPDDLDRASSVFWRDAGGTRLVTSAPPPMKKA